MGRRLIIFTRDRTNAAFRQRIQPYLAPLLGRGISTEVVVLPKWPLGRRRALARAKDFDGVLLHRKTLTAWDAAALGRARRLIYDFDDAVMLKARAPETPHPGRARRFARTVGRADLVTAGSPVLAARAEDAGAERVETVPTGLNVRGRYVPKADYAAEGPVRLVWIGSRSTLRQLESLRPALEALGRSVPGLVLRVIADAPLQVAGLEVENVPWARETEARLLAETDIGISPLPDTAYTRGKCGFKVLQYMAAGLPVVASPVGVNADYVRDGETGLHARDAAAWVEAVGQLASDAALREQFGRAGRARAEAEVDVAVLAPRLSELIERTLA